MPPLFIEGLPRPGDVPKGKTSVSTELQADESWILRQQVFMQTDLWGKDWEMGVSACSLCTEPRVAGKLFICYCPVGPTNTNPTGTRAR